MGRRWRTAAAIGLLLSAQPETGVAAPAGQVTFGVHVSIAPTWFDPADYAT